MKWRVGECIRPLGPKILTVFVNDNGNVTRKCFRNEKKALVYVRRNEELGFKVVYC